MWLNVDQLYGRESEAYHSQDASLNKRDMHLLLLFCLLADCGGSLLGQWTRGKETTRKEHRASDAEDHSGFEWPHTSLRMLSGTEINISLCLGEKWNFYLLLLIFWSYNKTYTTLIQLKTSCINVREHFTQGKKQTWISQKSGKEVIRFFFNFYFNKVRGY